MNSKYGSIFTFFCLTISTCFGIDQAQLGSQSFGEFTTGTLPWSELVSFGRDPKFGSNIYYSDYKYTKGLAGAYLVGGPGEKNYQANALNFQANLVRSAARVEPRTPKFIRNSLAGSITKFDGQSEELSKLTGQQAGDPDLKYLESEMITPEIGTYQTTDNQFSFQAANDNVALNEAEMALFQGDRAAAIDYFDKEKEKYKNSTSKQKSSSNFQKKGVLRTKETAETFRDFFRYKQNVSQMNLNRMPTSEGLVANCQMQSSPSDDDTAVYRLAMNKSEAKLYDMKPPVYNFGFCDTYVERENSYLLRNLHVHKTLASISKSSGEMADSLDEVAKFLSNKNNSLADIYAYLNKNEAMKVLVGRLKGHQKCKKTNCQKLRKQLIKDVVEYKGFQTEIDPLRRQSVSLTQRIIATKTLPEELKTSTGLASSSNQKSEFYKKLGKFLKKSAKIKVGKSRQPKEIKPLAAGSSQISPAYIKYDDSKDSASNYTEYRDHLGVLRRVRTGNPVQLLARPKHSNLFDIISSRYKKKFLDVK